MGRVMTAVLLGLMAAAPAAAQKVDGNGVPYRAWDVDLSGGFHTTRQSDLSGNRDLWQENWKPAWSMAVGVGRYWTGHVKTEVDVATLSGVDYYVQEALTGADGRQVGDLLTRSNVHQTHVALAGTYQFLDNAFAHPYVSGGIRVALLRVRASETQYLYLPPGTPVVPVPVRERQGIDVRARPFVAAGSKSYFSERVFMRPEVSMAFDGSGFTQFALRLGVGVDF